jgi:thiamine-phosphate pyrophosphorylase
MISIKGYYFITDPALSRHGNIFDVKAALNAKVKIVQYRQKSAQTRAMYGQALTLRRLCRNIALFLINDRVDIALAVDADGVHLGQGDLSVRTARKLLGKKKIIGATSHNLKEARQARQAGADYIAISPVFATTTKKDAGSPCGLDLIRRARKTMDIPIVAIGGIDLDNASSVVAAGADCLCAISAVVARHDPYHQMLKFQEIFKKHG